MSDTWNLLIYAIISSDGDRADFNTALAEMRAALTTNGCRIGVQVNPAAESTRQWLTADGNVGPTPIGQVDVTLAAPLTDFLIDAAAVLGTAPTALVLFAHGDGLDHIRTELQTHHGAWPATRPPGFPLNVPFRMPSTPGVGPSPMNSNKWLSNPCLRKAIECGPGGRVDVLALNACYMGMFEIEYEMRDVCSVVVASQPLDKVWRYGDLVSRICVQPSMSAIDLGCAFVASIGAVIQERGDAISAVRTDGLHELSTAWDAFATAVTLRLDNDGDWDVLAELGFGIQYVDFYADMRSVLGKLGKGQLEVDQASHIAIEIYDRIVAANAAPTPPPALGGDTGLSVLLPNAVRINIEVAYAGLAVTGTPWEGFLKKLMTRYPPAPPPGPPQPTPPSCAAGARACCG